MADNDTDFDDILEGTVDEAKDAISDLDAPDYEGLLEAEEGGKDRKTIKEFLESKIDSAEEEAEEAVEEVDEETEEIVEEIEEETEGGLLGSFSKTSVLAGGLILGIVLGFAAAGMTSTAGAAEADPSLVQDNVETIAGSGNFNGTIEVSEPEVRHSMYFMNVTMSQEQGNETIDQTQKVYVSLDGRKLFLVREQLGQTLSPIDIPQTLQQIQQQEQAPAGNETAPEAPEVNSTQ